MNQSSDKIEFGTLEVFDQIYLTSYWGKGSGKGSSLKETEPYCLFLEDFINKHNIESIVDLGCGDWQFSKFLDFGKATYIGVDASKYIIDINKNKFSSNKVSFMHLPEDYLKIPPSDLLICKDVLQHLNNEEIEKIIRILPNYKYALITNDNINISFIFRVIINKILRPFSTPINKDIKIGDYRPIDLNRLPFGMHFKKVFEWKLNPYTLDQNNSLKSLILRLDSSWKKITYLYESIKI